MSGTPSYRLFFVVRSIIIGNVCIVIVCIAVCLCCILIKGENIPEPGIPESFKVLLKELQSLGLDVRVLAKDGSEIELKENIDEGDTDLRSVIEGDSKRYSQNESFGNYGYQEQEFKDGELTDVEHDEYTAEADGYTDDDYADVSDDNGSDDEE